MRVLLTRPQRESDAVATQLATLGFVAVIAPVTAIEPVAVTIPDIACDAILVTSGHATETLSDADAARLRSRPVFAVGSASAAAARLRGFVDVRIAAGDAQALVDLLRLTHPGPARLLYLAGHVRKGALEETLRGAGHDLSVVETYNSREISWSRDVVDTLLAAPPLACLHFSRLSAERALAQSRGSLEAAFDSMLHVCLSDDVAAPLRKGRERRVAVANQPRTDSLVQSLQSLLRSST